MKFVKTFLADCFWFSDVLLQALDVSYMDNITPKSVNAIPWDDLQSMIQIWTQQLEVVVKMLYAGERRLALQVFKNVDNSKAVWVEILRNLAEPEINAFIRFGESVAASECSPEKLSKLLEMYESMEKCEHSVIQVFDGQACGEIRTRYRELLKQVLTLRPHQVMSRDINACYFVEFQTPSPKSIMVTVTWTRLTANLSCRIQFADFESSIFMSIEVQHSHVLHFPR